MLSILIATCFGLAALLAGAVISRAWRLYGAEVARLRASVIAGEGRCIAERGHFASHSETRWLNPGRDACRGTPTPLRLAA